jgi:hypothetical protein
MVNGSLLNFGKVCKDYLRDIFDQWPKLKLDFDALSNQKILKGVYYLSFRSTMDEKQRESKNDLTNHNKKFEIKHDPIWLCLTCLLLAGQYFLYHFLKTET